MLILLLGAGLYYTFVTGCFQLRYIRLWFRETLFSLFSPARQAKYGEKEKGISSFQSFTTALAGTMGTGNIVGVATALSLGGPGSILWMWIAALLGMMTKYAEIVLGMLYRKHNADGTYTGGPMIYLERGLGCRPLAVLFSLAAILASFGMGNMTQAGALAESVTEHLPMIPRHFIALILMLLTGFVIFGGLSRIANVTQCLIPLFSLLYLGGCGIILVRYRHLLPGALSAIFTTANSPASAAGGVGGYTVIKALRYGVARGVFSNEAGLGSSVMVHTASRETEPVREGMWGIFEVFCDTLLCCTVTALCLMVTGAVRTSRSGTAMALSAFSAGFPTFGGPFLTLAIGFFAFSTIISWCCYGEQAADYLWGKQAIPLYRVCYLTLTGIGCLVNPDTVWILADVANGLMALPNLVGILALSSLVKKTTQKYLMEQKQRK